VSLDARPYPDLRQENASLRPAPWQRGESASTARPVVAGLSRRRGSRPAPPPTPPPGREPEYGTPAARGFIFENSDVDWLLHYRDKNRVVALRESSIALIRAEHNELTIAKNNGDYISSKNLQQASANHLSPKFWQAEIPFSDGFTEVTGVGGHSIDNPVIWKISRCEYIFY